MREIILVGNPNVGKTTLYNTLTGENEKANNWHGVTVDILSSNFSINGEIITVFDIPGLYSLDGYSNEEKIACNFLNKNKDKLIINICDANNLDRNLILTEKLLNASFHVFLVINMINEVNFINLKRIEEKLNIPVFGIDARSKKSINNLKIAIYNYYFLNNDKKNKNLQTKTQNIDIIKQELKLRKKDSNVLCRIDKIVLNKFFFVIVLISLMFLIFYLTFGLPGEIISGLFRIILEFIFSKISNFINLLSINAVLKLFLISGILGSVKIVLEFLPQIILLISLISILEDTGIMSRVAFMCDGVLQNFGLTGKSLFSILIGYGCTASAVLASRNLENKVLRKRTIFVLPFASCSAKLPVFLIIASLFFEKQKYLFVFALYIFSVLLILLFSMLAKKITGGQENYFFLEMPKYRFPKLNKILKDALSVALEFLVKVGSVIMLAGAVMWIMQNFSPRFRFVGAENFTESILFFVSSKLSFIFKLIKLDSVGIISVLLFGLIAKELIVVGLASVNSVTNLSLLPASLVSVQSVCNFTPFSSLIFLLFVYLYSPCFSALFTIKNEIGSKSAIMIFVFQFLIAFACCYLLILLVENIYLILLILLLIILAFLIKFVIKFSKKKVCKGNCNVCRKF